MTCPTGDIPDDYIVAVVDAMNFATPPFSSQHHFSVSVKDEHLLFFVLLSFSSLCRNLDEVVIKGHIKRLWSRRNRFAFS